jgi:hypothetical protein
VDQWQLVAALLSTLKLAFSTTLTRVPSDLVTITSYAPVPSVSVVALSTVPGTDAMAAADADASVVPVSAVSALADVLELLELAFPALAAWERCE